MLSNLIEFVARTHILVLHFPIALITIAAILESVRLFYFIISRQPASKLYRPSTTASAMLTFGLLATILAVTTGLVLGFDHSNAVDLHRILGIVAGILVLITAAALLIALRKSTFKWSLIYLCLLIPSALTVSAAAHFGGELTHGKGFLTDPLKAMFVEPIAPQAQEHNISNAALESFNTTILPIFNNSCTKCHGEKKQKGDIRLDTLAYTLDADAQIVDRDNPDDSELLYRIELPADDDDAMPPLEKAEPLTDQNLEDIRAWLALLKIE
jgi:uncharacterized membrane protein